MAELGPDRKLPRTSPPDIPYPPNKNVPINTPRAAATPRITEEEQAALDEAERLAQEQDMEDAKVEEAASDVAMGALEGAFIPYGITRHRGVGPIQYETKRGLIKVFPGDLVCHLNGPVQPIPEPPPAPEDIVLDDDYIVVSEAVLSALLFTIDYKLFPDTLEYRAGRIGEERRKAAAAPPGGEVLSQKRVGGVGGPGKPGGPSLPSAKPSVGQSESPRSSEK